MRNKLDALRRRCYCGGEPELIGSMHTGSCYVRCPRCGCRAITCSVPSRAWAAWDNQELTAENNKTIWELM